jgi:hypothetical protein
MSQFAPGELVFAPPKKSIQKKGGPGGLPVKPLELTRPLRSLALRFPLFRALAELAGFAAPYGLQIQLKQGGSLNPEMVAMLGCSYGYLTSNGVEQECSPERDSTWPSQRKQGSSCVLYWLVNQNRERPIISGKVRSVPQTGSSQ